MTPPSRPAPQVTASDPASRVRRAWPLPERSEQREVFHASPLQVALRLVQWLVAAADYAWRRLRAWNRGEDGAAEHGVLLRQTLERMGGTFVKLGQQLSTRLDLLPFEACQELAKMLDRMPAFPVEQAITAIERTTGRPLRDTFSAFDPEPLGAASIGCVYHAVLQSGEEVAVKVRRPGVGALFAADLKVLDLLGGIAEFFTLIRPGMTGALRSELRTMLLEELDFRSEARNQDLFRRRATQDGCNVTAPRVYVDLCSGDVMVSEFVRGVWVQDLLAAKDAGDAQALDYCARLDITPGGVARNLLHTLYWSNFELLFYHADPHPANILVRPGNELVLIDFGAVGPTTHRNRRNYAELFRHQGNRDTGGMVLAFTNIISPLPDLDVEALCKEGVRLTARWQYGFESRNAEWWERSSAGMWIGMLELTRTFQIPINIDTVRLVRSSLLYDTIAARLDDSIDLQVEFDRYRRGAQQRMARRGLRRGEREFGRGRPLEELDRAVRFAQQATYHLHEIAAAPATSPLASVGKGAALASRSLSLVATLAGVTLAAGLVVGVLAEGGGTSAWWSGIARATASPWYWVAAGLLILRSYRSAQLAIGDVDPPVARLPAAVALAARLSTFSVRR